MRVRPPKDVGLVYVAPAESSPFEAEYPTWVDVDADVARQLSAQGWELESVQKAKRTKAKKAAAAEKAPAPDKNEVPTEGAADVAASPAEGQE